MAGKYQISVRPETHKALKDIAEKKDISVSRLASRIIDNALDIEDAKVKVSGECSKP